MRTPTYPDVVLCRRPVGILEVEQKNKGNGQRTRPRRKSGIFSDGGLNTPSK
jgi:hypothetical protein